MLALEGLLPRICHAEKRVQGGRLEASAHAQHAAHAQLLMTDEKCDDR